MLFSYGTNRNQSRCQNKFTKYNLFLQPCTVKTVTAYIRL